MMSGMHATPTDPLDAETFATPRQELRYTAAMERIADNRKPGPVRVYVTVPPAIRNLPRWDKRAARIAAELPVVELLDYRSVFAEQDRPYDWPAFADSLDGLIVVAKPKRRGSRVHMVGPIARLELKTLIAHKPVLLHSHNDGLIPVIDCKSQILGPEGAERLKLTTPKRWKRDSATLLAALDALRPVASGSETDMHLDLLAI
jgi:hypothetical protein